MEYQTQQNRKKKKIFDFHLLQKLVFKKFRD